MPAIICQQIRLRPYKQFNMHSYCHNFIVNNFIQINVYAKFTTQINIQRVHTFARAVCAEELQALFYSGNQKFDYIIACLTIVLPFVLFVLLCIFARNVSDDAVKSFTHPSKHGILVGMTLCGIHATILILLFDIAAVLLLQEIMTIAVTSKGHPLTCM